MNQRLKVLSVLLAGVLALSCKDLKNFFVRTTTQNGDNAAPTASPGSRLFAAGDTTLVAAVDRSTLIFDATVLSFDTTHIAQGQKYRRMRVLVDSILREPGGMDDFGGDTV